MRYLAKIFVALCALGLSSCSEAKNQIVGTWVPTDYVCENRGEEISEAVIESAKNEFLCNKFEFDASGSYKWINSLGFFLEEGTYEIKGDSLVMTCSKLSSRARLEDDFKQVEDSPFVGRKCADTPSKYLIRDISNKKMVLTVELEGGSYEFTNVFFLKKE